MNNHCTAQDQHDVMAMDNANVAALLDMISYSRSFEELVRVRSLGYAGTALYKQMVPGVQTE